MIVVVPLCAAPSKNSFFHILVSDTSHKEVMMMMKDDNEMIILTKLLLLRMSEYLIKSLCLFKIFLNMFKNFEIVF